MVKRRHINTTERLAILERGGRTCHLCNQPILPTDPWEVSHPTPLALGGADDDTNRLPAHKTCHREQTDKIDAERIARAQRQEALHLGAKAPPKQPIRSKGFASGPKRQPRPSLPPRKLYAPIEPDKGFDPRLAATLRK